MRAFVLLMGLAITIPSRAADEEPKPPEGWKVFTPKDRAFSVWLPDMGGRQSESERSVIVRGTRIRVNVVKLQLKDGLTLTASSLALPLTLARRIPPQELLESIRDAVVQDARGTIEGEKEIKQGRLSGKEYTIATGKEQIRLRLFALPGRVYQATATGTKDQVQTTEAIAFLDSYKLPAPGTEVGVDPVGRDNLAGKAATVIAGDMFGFFQTAVKEKRTADGDLKGFTLTKNVYRDSPDKGGILIGFNVGMRKFLDKDVIGALQPIYLTRDGEITGEWIGPKPASATTVKAKSGYVVGGVKIRTGLGIDGFSLTFTKLDKDRLQVKETYQSDWIGLDGGQQTTLGGHGYFFVGVYGHLNDQTNPCSLGLITVLKPKE
jgi:hypothetical protein